MEMIQSLVTLLIPIGVIILIYKYRRKMQLQKKEKRKAVIQSKVNEVKNYFDLVNQEKKLPTINTNILLKKDEVAYLQDSVRLFELRAARKSTRGGGAVRVAKGVYIGGTSGTSRSFDELREIDSGRLILTNQRIVFDGNTNTRDIKLDKIISVTGYIDGIEIAIEGRAKSQTYIGMSNPYLWKALIHYLRQIPETGELPTADIEVKLN